MFGGVGGWVGGGAVGWGGWEVGAHGFGDLAFDVVGRVVVGVGEDGLDLGVGGVPEVGYRWAGEEAVDSGRWCVKCAVRAEGFGGVGMLPVARVCLVEDIKKETDRLGVGEGGEFPCFFDDGEGRGGVTVCKGASGGSFGGVSPGGELGVNEVGAEGFADVAVDDAWPALGFWVCGEYEEVELVVEGDEIIVFDFGGRGVWGGVRGGVIVVVLVRGEVRGLFGGAVCGSVSD